jgi:deoxyribonuclease-4
MASTKVYEMVTERIVKELEQGIIPWQKPWSGCKGGAFNYKSGRTYCLMNQFILLHRDGYLTFNQCKAMGGKRVVFHPAAQGKAERYQAVELTKDRLKILRDYLYLNDLGDMMICPETMGKLAQIGTVEEVTAFCEIDPIFTPCVDFGHINARENGSLKTSEDYKVRLEYMLEKLGYERMVNFHIHFSKIMYSAKGEIKHLTFEDEVYGPNFAPLAEALKELNLHPYIVSESAGTQTVDAAEMKKIYYGL